MLVRHAVSVMPRAPSDTSIHINVSYIYIHNMLLAIYTDMVRHIMARSCMFQFVFIFRYYIHMYATSV